VVEMTARYCGMHWLPPIVMHDAHQADRDTLQTQADRYREVLQPFARGAANG